MALYTLEATRDTLRGTFSRDYAPVLTIDSGDTVVFKTLDAGWYVDKEGRRFEPRDKETDYGHAMTGPVFVRGARPGTVLEIKINDLVPGEFGWTNAGGFNSEVNRRLGLVGDGKGVNLKWSLDVDGGVATNQFGWKVDLHPHMGLMGNCPGQPGVLSTIPPRNVGGNIDCRELVAGATLFLPVEVEGALFSTGDAHANMGDGEVSGLGIECPMERCELTFTVRDDLHFTMPRAFTPAGWITFGLSEDLNEATYQALGDMVQLMTELYGIEKAEALGLASVAVHMRISQIVNGVKGVHALLPHDAVWK